jgi:hypothetical protein
MCFVKEIYECAPEVFFFRRLLDEAKITEKKKRKKMKN